MGERPTPESVIGTDVKRERELARLESRAGDFVHQVYQEGQDNDTRVAKLRENLQVHLDHMADEIDANAILASLERCRNAEDEETFVDHVIGVIRPILVHQVDHPDVARRIFLERHEFTPLNEVLSYGMTEDGVVAHIHLAPASDIPKLRGMVIDGLKELARRIQADPQTFGGLKRVTGSSWIIAQHPKVLERLGFTIDGPVSKETAERAQQAGETRDMSRAHIDREDFLRRYGTEV